MHRRLRLCTVVCVRAVLLVILLTTTARAQPHDKPRAEALFREGREAMKRGDAARACPIFAKSLELDASLGTLLNLAVCEKETGNFLSAAARFTEFLERASATDDRRPTALQHQAETRAKLAKVRLTSSFAPPGSKLFVDGRELPLDTLGSELVLNPGTHRFGFHPGGGALDERVVTLAAGESSSIEFTAMTDPTPRAPVAEPGNARDRAKTTDRVRTSPRQKPDSTPQRPPGPSTQIGYVVGAVALACLATGAVTGILAFDEKSTLLEHCDEDLKCDEEGVRAGQAAKTLATISTVTFAASGAGLAVAGYLLLARPDPNAGSHARPATLLIGARGSF